MTTFVLKNSEHFFLTKNRKETQIEIIPKIKEKTEIETRDDGRKGKEAISYKIISELSYFVQPKLPKINKINKQQALELFTIRKKKNEHTQKQTSSFNPKPKEKPKSQPYSISKFQSLMMKMGSAPP